MDLELPELLLPYREVIESTLRPAVLFRPDRGPTRPRDSKLGGRPYFPFDANPDIPKRHLPDMAWTPWPKHPDTGRELQLLLQVDFAQMPGLPSFPTEGILQLFVDDEDWHDLDRHLRVVYHEDTRAEPYDFGDVSVEHFRVPESALTFHRNEEVVTCSDFRFDELYAAPAFDGRSFAELDRARGFALHRAYLRISDHRYHDRDDRDDLGRGRNKLGGYHYSQNAQDPRRGRDAWRDSVLLAQFQDYDRLSWGDGGSAQFFIKTADLENRDFSDLLFHWDST